MKVRIGGTKEFNSSEDFPWKSDGTVRGLLHFVALSCRVENIFSVTRTWIRFWTLTRLELYDSSPYFRPDLDLVNLKDSTRCYWEIAGD